MTANNDYERRINRAMDYISRHLDGDLPLEAVAREAAFSPFHFHRIFKAMTGEPVAAFIRRVRLERAASDLQLYPRRSVTEIAGRNGFDSPAVFARAFRERFGMSASALRKECKANRKASNERREPRRYALPVWAAERPGNQEESQVEVRIEDMPAIHAVYVRRMGPYNVAAGQAWEVLCRWAGPRGLLRPGAVWFSVSHDDPDVTSPDKLRYDACLAVDAATPVDDTVGVLDLPARRVAKARYVGPSAGIIAAYRELFGEWLPASGFVPTNAPAIEVYLPEEGNRPETDQFVMDVCLPVTPA